jgi:transposase-like protein
MDRILSANPSLLQHILQVHHSPEAYRPFACPHCGLASPWLHGVYVRKADRSGAADDSLNPVPVCRFLCRGCGRTCSRLPLAIAPRRWYDWEMQQRVLQWLLSAVSLHQASERAHLDRRTVRRWREWLREQTALFSFHLRERFPEQLGRIGGDWMAFWRACLDLMPLCEAMALLGPKLDVP